MEVRVLRYFLTVVREESITKAAEVLHITQPTLSRQLAQLEGELGVTLFSRGTRKISLTSEGMLLKRRAEEILELVDKTEQEMARQEELVEGTVAVGCGDLLAVQTLGELIRSFIQKYPRVTFDLYTATADHIKERMDRGVTDIGLLLEPVEMDKYEHIRLNRKESWGVAMRPDDPLAGKEKIRPEDLKGRPLILPRRLSLQSELASWFGEDYRELQVRFTSNLNSSSSIMVCAGLGYSLAVEGSLAFWDREKIVFRPLSPALSATSALAWKRNQPFAPAAEKFIAHVRSSLTQRDGQEL